MPLDQGKTKALVNQALAAAKKAAGGKAAIAAQVTSARSANTRFAVNQITSTGDVDETRLSVTVMIGKRHASSSTNQTDAASIKALCERVTRMAKLAPEDPEVMPLLGAQKYRKAPGAHDPATEKLAAPARATAAATAIAAAEEKKLVVAGFFEHAGSSWAIGNSAGMFGYHKSTSAELSMTARTADGSGSGWAGAYSHKAADLNSAQMAAIAAAKGVDSAKPRRLEAGRYTVVLEPAAVGELLGFLTDALDARRADEGRSFMTKAGGGTRIGEKIFGDAITLSSDPTDPLTPAAPFSSEGLPYAPQTWIDKGTVKALVYSRFWAAKQDVKPTGHPNVYSLAGGTAASTDELVSGVKRGVLVTRFWYTRWVDPQTILITGLTRDGTFLIEDGKIVAPVNNFRFNESPVTMLQNAEAMTKDTIRVSAGMRVPAIRTSAFNLASISEAV